MCLWIEHKPIKQWYDNLPYRITTHIRPGDSNRSPWFDVGFWPTFVRIYVAHWFLAVAVGLIAALPWIPTRFTMRGLFVGMTIVAVITGAIVWVDRNC